MLAAPARAHAQDDEPLGARGRIAQQLWGPRLLLRHQDDLKLTDVQKKAIRKIVKDTQGRLVDLRFDLDTEVNNLEKLLAQPKIDEAAALAASQRVMALEAEIKQVILKSFIQMKNLLTPEQQKIMAEVSKRRKKAARERLRGRQPVE
jgi:Spy/CpxP family protein refolding chaperone